jgi:hypothetical protein
MFTDTLSAQRKSMLMNRPEGGNDPYADLRRVSDQLAQLLVTPQQEHLVKLNEFLNDEGVKSHLDHNSEALKAKNRIDAERQDKTRSNRYRIGAELMRIADTVQGCADCADTAGGLADDALRLAVAFSPALLV